MLKPVLFALGWLFFVIGIIGAFIPLLPTTPFLLLAALCFSKSSPRFHAWLLGLPVMGAGVRDWNENRVIRPRAKVLCLSMILLGLVFIWRSPKIPFFAQLSATLIMVSVSGFVLTRKSKVS